MSCSAPVLGVHTSGNVVGVSGRSHGSGSGLGDGVSVFGFLSSSVIDMRPFNNDSVHKIGQAEEGGGTGTEWRERAEARQALPSQTMPRRDDSTPFGLLGRLPIIWAGTNYRAKPLLLDSRGDVEDHSHQMRVAACADGVDRSVVAERGWGGHGPRGWLCRGLTIHWLIGARGRLLASASSQPPASRCPVRRASYRSHESRRPSTAILPLEATCTRGSA
jgi:hypothetical protein